MKLHHLTRLSFILAAVCTLLAGVANTSYAQRGSGRLLIKRAPDLGNWVYVDVRIDGARAGTILYGHSYERAVPAGRHVIRVTLQPAQYSYSPSELLLNVRPGRTYRFVATTRRGGALTLAPAN